MTPPTPEEIEAKKARFLALEQQLRDMTRRAWEQDHAPKIDPIMRIVVLSAYKDRR